MAQEQLYAQDQFWWSIIQKYENRINELQDEQNKLQNSINNLGTTVPAYAAFKMADLANKNQKVDVESLIQMPSYHEIAARMQKTQIPELTDFNVQEHDIQYMNIIKEMAQDEKDLVKDINRLVGKEWALKKAQTDVETFLRNERNKKTPVIVDMNTLLGFNDRLVNQNKVLRHELPGLMKELDNLINNIEGPLKQDLKDLRKRNAYLEGNPLIISCQCKTKDHLNRIKNKVEEKEKQIEDEMKKNKKLTDEIAKLNDHIKDLEDKAKRREKDKLKKKPIRKRVRPKCEKLYYPIEEYAPHTKRPINVDPCGGPTPDSSEESLVEPKPKSPWVKSMDLLRQLPGKLRSLNPPNDGDYDNCNPCVCVSECGPLCPSKMKYLCVECPTFEQPEDCADTCGGKVKEKSDEDPDEHICVEGTSDSVCDCTDECDSTCSKHKLNPLNPQYKPTDYCDCTSECASICSKRQRSPTQPPDGMTSPQNGDKSNAGGQDKLPYGTTPNKDQLPPCDCDHPCKDECLRKKSPICVCKTETCKPDCKKHPPESSKSDVKSDVAASISTLQLALEALQEKCKNKDYVIDALRVELETADSKIFGNLLTQIATRKDDVPTDYDRILLADTLPHEKSKDAIAWESDSKTQTVDPSPLKITHVRKIGPESILAKWDISDSPEINGYEIRVDGIVKTHVFNRERDSTVIDGISSNQAEIEIYAFSKAGLCPPPAIKTYNNGKIS